MSTRFSGQQTDQTTYNLLLYTLETCFVKGQNLCSWNSQAIYPRLRDWRSELIAMSTAETLAIVSSFAPTSTIYTPPNESNCLVQVWYSDTYQGPVSVLRRQILFAVGPTCRPLLSKTCRKPSSRLLCLSKQNGAELRTIKGQAINRKGYSCIWLSIKTQSSNWFLHNTKSSNVYP
jgi:hypothetical protein